MDNLTELEGLITELRSSKDRSDRERIIDNMSVVIKELSPDDDKANNGTSSLFEYEGFIAYPYYDLAVHKQTREEGTLICIHQEDRIRYVFDPPQGHKMSTDDKDQFDLSRATLTIGMGTTGTLSDGTTLTETTEPFTIERARQEVRHYMRDLNEAFASAPNGVIQNELMSFFYNVGKGVLTKKGGEPKYMNEPAPSSQVDTSKILGSEVDKSYTFQEIIDAGNWRAVCNRMTWYRRAGKKVVPGLVKRRDKEITNIAKSLED